MSDGIIGLYYFDGEDGCDSCQSMTGYYDDRVDPPHENCDCEQEMIFLDEDSSEVSIEYKNIEKEDSDSSIETYYNNTFENHSETVTVKRGFEFSESVNTRIDLPSELEDLVDYDDETLDINESLEMTIEPGESVEINILVTMKLTIYRAEKWIEFEGYEIKVADLEGSVENPTQYETELY
ncbi:MAG: hypothetical protein GY730_02025 [bacterium]|nr:hypothetical protein [bacterium]